MDTRNHSNSSGARGDEPPRSQARRFAEVDWLKAIGIVVVVFIHTVRPPWEIGTSPTELWIGRITRFAVPSFLMASGFLYATRHRVPIATTRRRLARILAPYLVFSVAAQLLRSWRGQAPASGSLAGDLFLAASFGPYYYVFIAAILVALAPLLARCTPRTLGFLLIPELAVQAYLEVYGQTELFWHLRNPLLWLPYFQLGWMARLAYPGLSQSSAARRGAAAGVCTASSAILIVLLADARPPAVLQTLAWLAIWSVLGALFFSICGRERPAPGSALTRALSDVTYPVYLAHLFFLGTLREWFPAAHGVFEPIAIFVPWAGSLLLSIALVYIGRAVLGQRSRTWLGA